MSAAAGIAALVAATPGAVEVALGTSGSAVTDRIVVVLDRTSGLLRSTISFGPYPTQVECSHVLVYVGGQLERLALPGELSLPPGVPFIFDLELALG